MRGAIETDGFQHNVKRRSDIFVMTGRSASGVGAPVFLYLSKSVYKSPIAVLFLGSKAVEDEREKKKEELFPEKCVSGRLENLRMIQSTLTIIDQFSMTNILSVCIINSACVFANISLRGIVNRQTN